MSSVENLFASAIKYADDGKLSSSERELRSILKIQPMHAQAMHLLSIVLFQLNKIAESTKFIQEAISIDKNDAHFYATYGNILYEINEKFAAEIEFKKAISINEKLPTAWIGLGKLYFDRKNWLQAVHCCDKALSLGLVNSSIYANKSAALNSLERYDESIVTANKSLEMDSINYFAMNNLAVALSAIGKTKNAIFWLKRALQINPTYANGIANLGFTHVQMARYHESKIYFEKVIALDDRRADVYREWAFASYRTYEGEKCIDLVEKSLELNPSDPSTRWLDLITTVPSMIESKEEALYSREKFLIKMSYFSDWIKKNEIEHLEKSVGYEMPFYFAYHGVDDKKLLKKYGEMSIEIMSKYRPKLGKVTKREENIFKVGIISSHIYDHSVWNAITQWVVHAINETKFELYVYDLSENVLNSDSAEVDYCKSNALYKNMIGKSLKDIVENVMQDELDVIMYPEIGMDKRTYQLACLKMADTQVALWGHPETSGLSTIDYYISGSLYEDAESDLKYSERLYRLPNLGTYYTRPKFDYSCNNPYKNKDIDFSRPIIIMPGTIYKYQVYNLDVVLDIILRNPSSQFVFFDRSGSEEMSNLLSSKFNGNLFKRNIVILNWLERSDFYQLLSKATLMLDTIDFSGFNTALHAINCSLPIVSLKGNFMRGRLGSALLERIGLSECVAPNKTQFVEIASKILINENYRNSISNKMRINSDLIFEDRSCQIALQEFLFKLLGESNDLYAN